MKVNRVTFYNVVQRHEVLLIAPKCKYAKRHSGDQQFLFILPCLTSKRARKNVFVLCCGTVVCCEFHGVVTKFKLNSYKKS